MIKLIASDVDGTLVGSNHKISEKNIEIIKKAQNLGIKFLVTTGRLYEETAPLLEESNIFCEYIVMNGAEYRNESGDILSSKHISTENAEAIVDYLKKNEMYAEIYTNKGMFSPSTKDICIDAVATKINHFVPDLSYQECLDMAESHNEFKKLTLVSSIKEILNKDITIGKILCFSKNLEKIELAKKSLANNTSLSVTASFPINIEITNTLAQKDLVLLEVAKKYGIEEEEIMVIGDSYNDYTMLSRFKNSFAMGNALPEIKKVAKFETTDNNNDGVANAILKMISQ